MLNGRLYRAAFAPFLLALATAAFSLGSRPPALTSMLAPDAFEGAPAFAELRGMIAHFSSRRPGSGGDQRLARYVAGKLEALGGTGAPGESRAGGFSVHTYEFSGQTIEGERTLSTVVAQRPGSTGAAPILIVAHRDAAARGSAAELSATAALLELGEVFSTRETKRTIVLVSTSGGSGGAAGAARLAGDPAAFGLHGPFDAAIVIGDIAGTLTRAPMVIPYSDGLGSAPLELQATVAHAIAQEAGVQPGGPSTLGQLAHLAFPLTLGEQGVLDGAGIPAVLVQVSGEGGPSGSIRDRVSPERLEGFGRAILSAVDALDSAPEIPRAMQTAVQLRHKLVPLWALRLLIGTLLLPPFAAAFDGLARARRRGLRVGRWALWTLSCSLPFLGCAVFAYVLGWLGVLGAAPPAPVPASALPLDGRALTAVVALALTFALTWLLWGSFVRRLHWGVRPDPEAAGLALTLVLLAVAALAWLSDPLTALLALPALHLWLAFGSSRRWDPLRAAARRAAAFALVVAGAVPIALLIAFYAHQLGLGLGTTAWTGLLLLAGGYVGAGAALLWSVAFGCLAAAAMCALADMAPPQLDGRVVEDFEVSIRGPLSYAGPGSLGGTESALRR
jgi:hypothetical protein